MTAEATPRAARTGFRHALVSTTRHPDVDEPALAIPNRVDDRASTRHVTGWPVLEPVDGASCQRLNLLGHAQPVASFWLAFIEEPNLRDRP
jgi:hypothetical protein